MRRLVRACLLGTFLIAMIAGVTWSWRKARHAFQSRKEASATLE